MESDKQEIKIKMNNTEEIIKTFQEYSVKLVNDSIENGRDIAQSQAGTESESSKDYIGRVVYEFFQNAVDRADKNIWMELTKDAFIVSNDGKEFSIYPPNTNDKKSDFHSLNTIHNGEKIAGESIGNKGVGFKSCWNVSEHVIIESKIKPEKDGVPWGFELFNPVKSDHFSNENIKNSIKKAKGKVPSFYFPKYYESKNENFKENAVTKITIWLKDEAYGEIQKELEEFKKSKYIFLNQLKGKDKTYNIFISIDDHITKLNSQDENLPIISLKDSYQNEFEELKQARKNETYANIPEEPNIAIAFPSENIDDLNCKFYTYLPTTIDCGFNVLIHADFALDNARKSIPENNYNEKILQLAAKMLVNQLLEKTELHSRKDFGKFLIPKHRDGVFAESVWKELIKDNNLTKILEKVYTKKRRFPKDSYEVIFKVINKWMIDKKKRNWGDHYTKVYEELLKYFCNEKIFIVPIGGKEITFLPPKKDKKVYEHNLFYQQDTQESNLIDYGLLEGVSNIKLSNFVSIGHDMFFHNKVIRKFSTVEILRALKGQENINIIKFIKQLLDNTKDELSNDVKEMLLELKLPTNNNGFTKVSNCFISIDNEIIKLFSDKFKEVDKEKLQEIDSLEDFLTKIGVANNRLPFDEKHPFKDGCEFSKSNDLKYFIKNSLSYLDDDLINQLKSLKCFYDERKSELYKPSEVFLFKEHDRRKIDSIAQEIKKQELQKLYIKFNIEEIEDTPDDKKLMKQLEKMKEMEPDSNHQDIYKKITFALAKIDHKDSNIKIPLLGTNIESGVIEYIDGPKDIVFLETKYKQYKEQLKGEYKYIAYLDTNIAKNFLEKIGIYAFNPNYNIVYKDDNEKIIEPEEDNDLKQKLKEKFLASFFALANEILGSRFEKEDAIKRWENLIIKRAPNVVLTIKDKNKEITVSSTDKTGVDVLFIPIKDKQNKPTQIGEVAHDLKEPFKKQNLRKFAQVFAEGIFRSQKLKSDFELYITAHINGQGELQEDILINKGIDEHHIKEMYNFIQEQLLSNDEKEELVRKINEITNLSISKDSWKDFTQYEALDMTFEEFKNNFQDKFENIIDNFTNDYKSYAKHKILKSIDKKKEELQVLCFMQKGREYFDTKLKEIEHKNYERFKIDNDVYSMFDVDEKNENSDEYIESRIDWKYETDDINSTKFTIELIENKIEPKEEPNVGNANKSKEDIQKSIANQEKNQKRGLGQELKISFQYSKILFEENLQEKFTNKLKQYDFGIDKNKINIYLGNLDERFNKFKFAEKVINIAYNELDGLGYDLVIPVIKNSEIENILKVELKSTKIVNGEVQVHFSKNEIARIKYFIENKDKDFRVWLNHKENDITEIVKKAIEKLPNELPFYFEDYILKLGVAQ